MNSSSSDASFLSIFCDSDRNSREQKLDAYLMSSSLSPDDLHLLSTRAEEVRKRKILTNRSYNNSVNGDHHHNNHQDHHIESSNGAPHISSNTHGAFFKATSGFRNRLSEGVNRIMETARQTESGTSKSSSSSDASGVVPVHYSPSSKTRVFGVPLEEHLHSSKREIAVVIETCACLILKNPEEEGLFRISGSASRIKKLKCDFDGGRQIDVEDLAFDPHTVAGTLKSYLRELPIPLFTYDHYSEWLEAAKAKDSDVRLESLRNVCQNLPKENWVNLRYLVKFLYRITQFSASNKMSAQNLAIAISPSLIWSPDDKGDIGSIGMNMTAANLHCVIIYHLITHADYFFPGEIEFKNPDPSSETSHPPPAPSISTSSGSDKVPPGGSSSGSHSSPSGSGVVMTSSSLDSHHQPNGSNTTLNHNNHQKMSEKTSPSNDLMSGDVATNSQRIILNNNNPVRVAPKKPAPPAPPALMRITSAGGQQEANNPESGVVNMREKVSFSGSSQNIRIQYNNGGITHDSPNSHSNKKSININYNNNNNDEDPDEKRRGGLFHSSSSPISNQVSTAPRKRIPKPERPSLMKGHSYGYNLDSSSTETLDSTGERESPSGHSSSSFDTSSLDRKDVVRRIHPSSKNGENGDKKVQNRKSAVMPQQRLSKLVVKPSVPPPHPPPPDLPLNPPPEIPPHASSPTGSVREQQTASDDHLTETSSGGRSPPIRSSVPPTRPARARDVLKQKMKSMENLLVENSSDSDQNNYYSNYQRQKSTMKSSDLEDQNSSSAPPLLLSEGASSVECAAHPDHHENYSPHHQNSSCRLNNDPEVSQL